MSVLGTSVHKMFEEHQAEGYVAEERLYAEVDGWTISGAIDLLQRSEADGTLTILDYKCTSVWSVIYGKSDWHKQLNFYAWLVEQNNQTVVDSLQIVAVLRDWQRSKANDEGYPDAPITRRRHPPVVAGRARRVRQKQGDCINTQSSRT